MTEQRDESSGKNLKSLTIEIPVSTAAFSLGILMQENARDGSVPKIYSAKWHREWLIDALVEALTAWPESSR